MARTLYSLSEQKIKAYPRTDDLEIKGLDQDYIVLTVVKAEPPERLADNQQAKSSWVVNLEAREYQQQWLVEEVDPLPDWTGFMTSLVPIDQSSTFGQWLAPVKEAYRGALVSHALNNNLADLQAVYGMIKQLIPPTDEQVAEWQGIADAHNIGMQF